MTKTVGFIGQGYVGRNSADDFERRGFRVVRYALEEPYASNGGKLKECDIVFIAVPTPTRNGRFVADIVRDVIKLVPAGKIAVIRSTVLPGTTESIQKGNPNIFVLHSPEFLTEANAAYDAAHPARNVVGIPEESEMYRKKAREVLEVLPPAPQELICTAREAESIKYGVNCFLYLKVLYSNLFYDVSHAIGADWDIVRAGIGADPRIGPSHLFESPARRSGRGAGGRCFIKDFAAFSRFYKDTVGDRFGVEFLRASRNKNLELLLTTSKDVDIVEEVYGKVSLG